MTASPKRLTYQCLNTLVLVICGLLFLAACGSTPQLRTQAVEQVWQPPLGAAWHYQIGSSIYKNDTFSDKVKIYNIDLFDNSAEIITFLHAKDIKVICYINVGAWEEWRSDAASFPESLLLGNYIDWEGERWLDIRPPEKLSNPNDGHALRAIMTKRFDLAVEKGCDAIEPDNVDSWHPETDINNGQLNKAKATFEDQLAYNRFLAKLAHDRGLSIGLKNNSVQAKALVADFDWAQTESCSEEVEAKECAKFQNSFIVNGKTVFWVEYDEDRTTLEDFCPHSEVTKDFSFIFASLELDGDVSTVSNLTQCLPQSDSN